MRHGNVNLCGWLCCCVAYLASLSVTFAGPIVQATHPSGNQARLEVKQIQWESYAEGPAIVTYQYLIKTAVRNSYNNPNAGVVGMGNVVTGGIVNGTWPNSNQYADSYGKSSSGSITSKGTLQLAGTGRYRFTITAQAGGGDNSQTVYWVPGFEGRVYYSLKGGDFGTRYEFVQNGQVIGGSWVDAGATFSGSIQTFDNTAVTIRKIETLGTVNYFGDLELAPSQVTIPVTTVTPSQGGTGSGSGTVTQPVVDDGNTVQNGGANVDTGGSANSGVIWTDRNSQTAVDVETYKQGVKNIVDAIKTSGGGGWSGGVNIDLSGTNSRLDTLISKTDAVKVNSDKVEELRQKQDAEASSAKQTREEFDAAGKVAAAVSYAQEAANELNTKINDSVLQGIGVPTVADQPTEIATSQNIQLRISATQVIDVPLNPFSPDGPFGGLIGQVAGYIKQLTAWGIVMGFFIWTIHRIKEMMAAPFAVAPFGNTIGESLNSIKVLGSGGGIGYVVRTAALLVVVPILLAMPLIVMASITAGLPWQNLVSTMRAGPPAPSGSMLKQAIGYADYVVPWSMLLAAPTWYFVVQYVLFPSQMFWMLLIKLLPL